MRLLKHFMLTAVLLLGVSLSVSAQRDDDKQRPPRKPPGGVPIQPKPPRENPPRDDDKNNPPKKPEGFFVVLDGEVLSR